MEGYDLTMDGKHVDLAVTRERVLLEGNELDVKAVSLMKKRKHPTFNIIIFMLGVILAGVLLYAALSTVFGSGEEGRPYRELDDTNTISYRRTLTQDPSPLFMVSSSIPDTDLSGSVEWRSEGWDIISTIGEVSGETSLMIMWSGNADDLLTRHISSLLIEIDSEFPYKLETVDLVKLGEDRTIQEKVSFIDGSGALSIRTGRSTQNIELDDLRLGQARNIQSGEVSSRKGCLIGISFPQGVSSGEIRVRISFGPNYYHETTNMGVIVGGVTVAITIIALVMVYIRSSRETVALVLDAGDREYVLNGEYNDLSGAYMKISKITIPKMKGESQGEHLRPGMNKGIDLVDDDEAKAIGKELKSIPGGSGKMIVHQCPECFGTELYYESGFMTGYKYHCKNCDYVGSFVIEKQVDFDR
ncbi:MAG: hypothetical protein JXA22_08000 [Candidatus Thermoplasmatota archaeon]|nr:hypothetical protein [Candidatus Thermoplasmatota archaeon]